MNDKNVQSKETERLNKQELWNKAGTNQSITRADVGLRPATNDSGIQELNEGYITSVHKFQLGDKLNKGHNEKQF